MLAGATSTCAIAGTGAGVDAAAGSGYRGTARSRAGLGPVPVTTLTTCVRRRAGPGYPRPDRAPKPRSCAWSPRAAATVTPRPAVLSGSPDGDARATPARTGIDAGGRPPPRPITA